jgi:hypothetical protein
MMAATGCKKEDGTYNIDFLSATAMRHVENNISYLDARCEISSRNFVAAHVLDWNFKILDENENVILEISDSNYRDLPFKVSVQKTPIQAQFYGMIGFKTNDFVAGDIFNGSVPKRVSLTATLEDERGNTPDFTASANVVFQELTD